MTIALEPAEATRHEGLRAFCKAYDLSPEETILIGGEDYELLFACPEEKFAALKPLLPQALRVGSCKVFDGAPLRNVPKHILSYQHGQA